MKIRQCFLFLFALFSVAVFGQKEKEYKILTVAFYNVENLFDAENDPLTFDDDRTPEGKDRWTEAVYRLKLKNTARVLSEIGTDESGAPPALIGLCEIENRKVLEDLLNQEPLRQHEYGIVHFDSPDRRGVDVALLYKKKVFVPTHYKAFELLLFDDTSGKRIFTRDQLLVSGRLDGEIIHLLINHWPSRSGGEQRSRPKRLKAAALTRHIIDSLFSDDPYAKIITMGDFNDDPTNSSIKEVLKAKKNREKLGLKELYNPMEAMLKAGLGTLAYRDAWNLFDQMLLSSELARKDFSAFRFYKAGIFNKPYLETPSGQYKGYPFRSFVNGFTGGYSDHFPVYVYLIKELRD